MIVWKEIESKGVKVLVSSNGDIKTTAHVTTYTRTRNGRNQIMESSFPERKVTPYMTKNGYLEVATMKSGKRVKHLVHRLIGMAFVDGYQKDLSINHINGIKTDNRIENLEWVSLARNTQHQWEIGLVNLRGDNNPGKKMTSKQVVYIRKLLAMGIPAHTLSIVAGVSSSAIEKIKFGKAWKHLQATENELVA